jgi:hypothetical protein
MQLSQVTLRGCWLNLAAKAFSAKIQLELMNQLIFLEPNKLQLIPSN